MIIKTFKAESWEAAEEKMHQEMGLEAIILDKRHHEEEIKDKNSLSPSYEITAGVEEKGKSSSPLINYSLAEIETIIENLQMVEIKKDKLPEKSETFPSLCDSLWLQLADETPPFEKLVDHLGKSTEMLQTIEPPPSQPWSLKEFLAEKGLGSRLTHELERKLRQQFDSLNFMEASAERDQALQFLYREVSRTLRVFGPITFEGPSPKVIALVGPSGSGKSTTALKIAYQHAQELKKKVAIIALKNPFLQTLYETKPTVLGKIPIRWVCGREELSALYEEIQEDVDLIVIDTFSANPYSWKEIDMLMPLLTEAVPAETHLVISALTKDTDAIGMVRHYAPLAPASFILSKTDETAQLGVLVNICADTHLPVSYLTTGPATTEALEIVDASKAARKILLNPKN